MALQDNACSRTLFWKAASLRSRVASTLPDPSGKRNPQIDHIVLIPEFVTLQLKEVKMSPSLCDGSR